MGVNGWHIHTHLRASGWFRYSCYQTTKSSVKVQMVRLCRTNVFQMAHPRQKCTSAIASLWSLKTTNGVQRPQLFCASNGGWQVKPDLSTLRGWKRDPSLLSLIQATRRHFHHSSESFLQEKSYRERLGYPYWGAFQDSAHLCLKNIAHLTANILLEALEFMHQKLYGSMKPYSGVCSHIWPTCWVQTVWAPLGADRRFDYLEADEDLLLTLTPDNAHCAEQHTDQDAIGELDCGLSLIWISGNHHRHFP